MAAEPTSNISFQNFYQATLTQDITASSTDIFLDIIPNGTEGFLVIEPDSTDSREIIYYNSKTATKVICPSTADGRGQDDTEASEHTQGATVIMAPIAAYYETLLSLFTTTPQGWTSLAGDFTVSSGYNQGNKSYVIDTASDQSEVLSPGMRFKVDRGTTPPTQSIDLEASSSQYASKSSPSGITFTDDFTCEAWIWVEDHSDNRRIISRLDSSNANGFQFFVDGDGRLALEGKKGGSSNYKNVKSVQSLPKNQWLHVAATLDMSAGTGSTYIEGVLVPSSVTSGGTAPTSITQAGNLAIGTEGAASAFFDGKISDARLWSAARTQTEIRDNMHQQLAGNETNLVGYWKLDGDWEDSTSNGNDLTASGSPVFADDNPMKATEYGIITAVTSTQITVFTGTDYGIPNMTLSNPNYSTQKTPFGFPSATSQWTILTLDASGGSQSSPTIDTWYNLGGMQITVPIGAWRIGYNVTATGVRSAGSAGVWTTLSTDSSGETDPKTTNLTYNNTGSSSTTVNIPFSSQASYVNTAQTKYYVNLKHNLSSTTSIAFTGLITQQIYAECAYL